MPSNIHPFHAPFPIEIEEHIIDQLVDHFTSLRRCSLTCRAWVPRSRFHLFGAIRIATKSAWNAVLDFFQENPHMRTLVRSLVMAPTPTTERTRLLGIYPTSLFGILPNLHRWDMRAPVDAKTNPSVKKVSFHPTTLVQLRYSPITELCVSSMQFTSRGEFVRLISSLLHLRVLQYTNVTFVPSRTASHNPRRPLGLSTLQISHWTEDDDILPWLLEASQSSLQTLTLRRQKSVRWQSATTLALLMSQLCSLTLHQEQHPHDGIDTAYLEAFRDALDCMQALRCGTTLKRLEIHLYLRSPSNNSRDEGALCNDPISLALFLSGECMRNCCQELEQALLVDPPVHLTIVTHLPSCWTHREVVLRALREDDFPNLHRKGYLNVSYSGGNACQSCTSHNGPVAALAISPDGSWIASVSSNLGILWDVHRRRPIQEWLHPMDCSPITSITFSPDSSRLACGGHIKGRRPFVQILPVDKGSRLAVLEGPAFNDDGPILQLTCAWLPDRLMLVCLGHSTISARIWDAQTFNPLFSWEDTTFIAHGSPSLLLSHDGRRLAVVAISLQDRMHRGTTKVPLCVLWDLDTGGPRGVLIGRMDQDKVLAASFDSEGDRLVLSFADHTIRVCSVVTRETLLSMTEPVPLEFDPRYRLYRPVYDADASAKAVTFSPDGHYLLSLRRMKIDERMETFVILWDSWSGYPLLRWEDTRPSGVWRNSGLVGFSSSGTHVAFTANDGRVHVFDLSHETHLSTPSGLHSMRHDTTSIVLSSDGRMLCWGTRGGDVEIGSF